MAYSYVQDAQNSTGQTTATTVATPNFATNPVAGNLIFAVAFFDGNNGGIANPTSITLADTLGNTYHPIDTLVDATNNFVSAIFYAKNIAGGAANAVTATFNGSFSGGSFYKGVAAFEYSGLDTVTPFVTGEYNAFSSRPSSGGGANSISSGSTPTLSGEPCAVLGFNSILHDTSGPCTAGTGFTSRVSGGFWQFGTGTNFAILEDKRVTATTAVAATFSSSHAGNYDSYVVAFHEPSGASLAGTPSDATSATGRLNSDFLAAATDATSAAGFLGKWPTSDASDTTSATGALSTAIRLAAAATDVTSAAGISANFSTVTLTAPLYTGVGSIVDANGSWSDGAPGVGSVVYFDATSLTILPNGEIVTSSNNFSATCQWNNGGTWSFLTLTVTPGLASYPTVSTIALGALSTAILIGSAATDLTSGAGSLSSQIKLAGAIQSISTTTATLVTAIRAAATAIDATSAAGILTGTSNALAGAATDDDLATAVLNAQIILLGTAVDVAQASGALATQILLGANAVEVSSASATIQTGIQIGASPATVSSASAVLSTGVNLSGAAIAATNAIAQLLTAIHAASAAIDATAATGTLTGGSLFSASATTLSTAIASLSTLIRLSASAQSGSAASGALTTQANTHIAGAAADATTAAGALSTQTVLEGAAVDTTTLQAAVTAGQKLSGAAQDASSGAADLFTSIDPDATATDESIATGALTAAGSDYIHADVMLIAPPEGFWPADGLLPWGLRLQRVGEMLIYAIDWSEWLANRWLPRAKVVQGDKVRPTRGATVQAICMQPGYTGMGEPRWPQSAGAQVLDGTAVWQIQELDGESLAATIVPPALWSASSSLIGLWNQRISNQVTTVVTIDTTHAVRGDYDIQAQVETTDLRQKIGKFRVKVR